MNWCVVIEYPYLVLLQLHIIGAPVTFLNSFLNQETRVNLKICLLMVNRLLDINSWVSDVFNRIEKDMMEGTVEVVEMGALDVQGRRPADMKLLELEA